MMRPSDDQAARSGMTDVNMTPLIDVSLVLVVILLLATPLAFESSFGVRRAATTARTADVAEPVERIELTIVSEDSVRVNRRLIARADLGVTLGPLVERSATRLVTVVCADSIRHGTFVAVLDAARLSGARDIAVAGR
ncbi:MAG: biopolymer transporter ExbD [Candidatus Krumholzibacteriia bacterium]